MQVPLAGRLSNFLHESSRQRLGKPKVLLPPPPRDSCLLFPVAVSRHLSAGTPQGAGRGGALKPRCGQRSVRRSRVRAGGLAPTPPSCDPGLPEPGCGRADPVPHANGPFSPWKPQLEPSPGSPSLHLPQPSSRHPRSGKMGGGGGAWELRDSQGFPPPPNT